MLVADLDREAGEAVVSGICKSGGQAEFVLTDVTARTILIAPFNRAPNSRANRRAGEQRCSSRRLARRRTGNPRAMGAQLFDDAHGRGPFHACRIAVDDSAQKRFDRQHCIDAGPRCRAIVGRLHQHETRARGPNAQHGRSTSARRVFGRTRSVRGRSARASSRRLAAKCTNGKSAKRCWPAPANRAKLRGPPFSWRPMNRPTSPASRCRSTAAGPHFECERRYWAAGIWFL